MSGFDSEANSSAKIYSYWKKEDFITLSETDFFSILCMWIEGL